MMKLGPDILISTVLSKIHYFSSILSNASRLLVGRKSMALTLSPLAENHLLLNKHFPNLTLGESSTGGKAVHIDSDTDIVVVAHTKFYLLVSGCHLLYPVHRLDTEYIVVTECATYHCFILVVAAGSHAAVSVRLRLSSPGGVATNSENENLKVEFDRHLYSHGDVISQALAVGEFMQILAEMVNQGCECDDSMFVACNLCARNFTD